ncbi:hypothetical protein SSP35_02_00180 [Streptomyces sp. NBRC 110611]|uniref:hypothetical protein n=1 Tax=Streptomyces sp. NBRC 110611 TaxID=1621259 RepID=UPI00082C1505|nr:hypothetical protein SSP35_02_00180 [Streptomyces sp. NBRC 110611]
MRQRPGRGTPSYEPARPQLPANLGHYEDTFRKADGSWRLAVRTVFLPFGGPTRRLGAPS